MVNFIHLPIVVRLTVFSLPILNDSQGKNLNKKENKQTFFTSYNGMNERAWLQ